MMGNACHVCECRVPVDMCNACEFMDPLAFQGLVGAAIASDLYSDLFRPDGRAKSISELRADKRISKLIDRL